MCTSLLDFHQAVNFTEGDNPLHNLIRQSRERGETAADTKKIGELATMHKNLILTANARHITPFALAIYYESVECVRFFSSLISEDELHGHLLLHDAAYCGHGEITKILIECYPTLILKRDKTRKLPIILAITEAHFDAFKLFIDLPYNLAKLKIDFEGIGESGILFLAISTYPNLLAERSEKQFAEEQLKIIDYLLKKLGIEALLEKNADQCTPLHVAVAKRDITITKLLVEKNPEALFVKDKDDRTPFDLASGNPELQDFLTKAMEQHVAALNKANEELTREITEKKVEENTVLAADKERAEQAAAELLAELEQKQAPSRKKRAHKKHALTPKPIPAPAPAPPPPPAAAPAPEAVAADTNAEEIAKLQKQLAEQEAIIAPFLSERESYLTRIKELECILHPEAAAGEPETKLEEIPNDLEGMRKRSARCERQIDGFESARKKYKEKIHKLEIQVFRQRISAIPEVRIFQELARCGLKTRLTGSTIFHHRLAAAGIDTPKPSDIDFNVYNASKENFEDTSRYLFANHYEVQIIPGRFTKIIAKKDGQPPIEITFYPEEPLINGIHHSANSARIELTDLDIEYDENNPLETMLKTGIFDLIDPTQPPDSYNIRDIIQLYKYHERVSPHFKISGRCEIILSRENMHRICTKLLLPENKSSLARCLRGILLGNHWELIERCGILNELQSVIAPESTSKNPRLILTIFREMRETEDTSWDDFKTKFAAETHMPQGYITDLFYIPERSRHAFFPPAFASGNPAITCRQQRPTAGPTP